MERTDSNGERIASSSTSDELAEAQGKIKKGEEISKEEIVDSYIDEFARELKDRTLLVIHDYRQRTESEKEEFEKEANERIIEKLLSPLNSLDRALNILKQRENNKDEFIENIINGIEGTQKELYKVLESEGVEIIEGLDEEQDLDTQTSVGTRIGERDDIVVEIREKGYRFKNSKVIKPAKVIVSKKEAETTKNLEGDKNG